MSRAGRTIACAGLACGVLDITAAFTQYALRGVGPMRILQSIASGLLGKSAFTGGSTTAALGLLLHFTIAFGAAAVYYAASRRIRWMLHKPVQSGILYGAAVHCFMQFVVVPASRIGRRPFQLEAFVTQLVIHMLFVGLPIALTVKYLSKGRR